MFIILQSNLPPFHNQDCSILDLIEKDIIKHQDYGIIMLCGDFNARVGCENDFITKDNNNFNPSFDCYVSDSARPRMMYPTQLALE